MKIYLSAVAISGQPGAGTETENILQLIEYAVMAPSGHNTQPWKFRLDGGRIELKADLSKRLPVVDPDDRELYISVGCALENLCIAAGAMGYNASVEIYGSEGVAVVLDRSGQSEDPDPLFAQIPARQTNRGVYNGTEVTEPDIAVLSGLCGDGIGVHFYPNGSPGFEALKEFITEGNRIQMANPHFRAELRQWMRYNRRESENRPDGLAYDTFGAPNLPRWISKPAMGMALNPRRQCRTDERSVASASHLVLFTCQTDDIAGWIEMGRVLERFLLTATGMGIAHSYFNQPNEVPQVRARMIRTLGLGDGHPAVLIRIGYGDPAPRSRRKTVGEFIIE